MDLADLCGIVRVILGEGLGLLYVMKRAHNTPVPRLLLPYMWSQRVFVGYLGIVFGVSGGRFWAVIICSEVSLK